MPTSVRSESPPFHVMDLDLSISDDGTGRGHAARRNPATAPEASSSSNSKSASRSHLRSTSGRSITSPLARASSSTQLTRETREQHDEQANVHLTEDTPPSSQRSQRIRKPSRKIVESGVEVGSPAPASAAAPTTTTTPAVASSSSSSSSSSARNLAAPHTTTTTTHKRRRKSLSASPDFPLSPASSSLPSPPSSSRLLSPPRRPSGETESTYFTIATTTSTPQRSRREHRPSRKAIEAEQDEAGSSSRRDRSLSHQGTALRSSFPVADQLHASEADNVTQQRSSNAARRSPRKSGIPAAKQEEAGDQEEAKFSPVPAPHLTTTHNENPSSLRAASETPIAHASTAASPANTTSIVAAVASSRPNRRVSSRLSKSVTANDMDLPSEEEQEPRGRSNTMSHRTFARVASNASNASSAITDLPDDDDQDQLVSSGNPETHQEQEEQAPLGSNTAKQPDFAAAVTDTDTEAEADSSRRSLRVRHSNATLSNVANNSTYSPTPVPQAIERTKATQRRRTLSASSSPAPSTPSSSLVGTAKKSSVANGTGPSSSSSSGNVTPRPRGVGDKTYLVAGLYARDAHVDPVAGSLRNGRLGPDGKVIEPPKELFPLPVHFGKDLLVQKVDFELPDIFLAQSGKLRERFDARRKPPPYRQIDRNRYVTRKKIKGELPQCNCDSSSDCGDNCLNRLLGFICDAETCPCGDRCTNVSLAKRPHARCDVAYYGQRGFGLRTLDDIPKDNLVDEYRGEVINLQEAARRVNELYKDTGNFYFLEYDAAAGEVLDGGLRGNVTRFANHSCNPNCYIEKFIICGTDEQGSAEFQIGLFALRDIAAGEELTYDYGWSQFTPKRMDAPAVKRLPDACYCGAPGCSGTLGAKRLTEKRATADTTKGAATIAAAVEAQEQHRRQQGGVVSPLPSAAGSSSRLTSATTASNTESKAPLARIAATTTGLTQQMPLGGSTARGTAKATAVLSRRAARRHTKPASRRLAASKRSGGSGALSRLHKLKSSSSTMHSATTTSASSSSSSSKRRILSIIKKPRAMRGNNEARAKQLLLQATQMVKEEKELARIAELAARTTNHNSQSGANADAETSTDASTATPTTVATSTVNTAATPSRTSTRRRKTARQEPVVLTSSTSPSPEPAPRASSTGHAEDDSKGAAPNNKTSRRGRSSPSSKAADLPSRHLSHSEAMALMQRNLASRGLLPPGLNVSPDNTAQQSPPTTTNVENGIQVTAQKTGTDDTPMDANETWVTVGEADDSISERDKGYSQDHPMDTLNDGTASRDHSDRTSDTSMSTSVEDVAMAGRDDSVSSEQRVESAVTADSAAGGKTHEREHVSPADAVSSASPVIPAGARKVANKRKRTFDETELDARSPPPKIMSSSTARARVRNAFASGRNRAAGGSASPPLPVQSSSPSPALTPTPPRGPAPVREATESPSPSGSAAAAVAAPGGRSRNPPRASRPQAITRDETEEPSSGSEYIESPSASPAPSGSTPAKRGRAKGGAKRTVSASGGARKQILTIHGVPRAVNHRASVVSRKNLNEDDPVTEGRQQYQSTRDLPHNIMTADGYFIPGLPTELLDLGIFVNMREARKARNAFLVRIRRSLLAGNSPVDATDEAAYRHPQKGTPLALARAAMAEKLGLTLPEESLYHLPRDQRTSTDPRIAKALAISIFKNEDGQVPVKAQGAAKGKAKGAAKGKGKARGRKAEEAQDSESVADEEEDELVEEFGDDESVVEEATASAPPVSTGKGKARQID